MLTVTFDTHCFVRKLKEAGFEEKQAELASKWDIREMELKIESRFEQVKGELNLIKWMLGIMLGGVMALILKAFFSSLKKPFETARFNEIHEIFVNRPCEKTHRKTANSD